MKTIEKKILPEYFERIVDGSKTYELRLADFDIESGDTLLLREWDGSRYTGRRLEKEVGYVGKVKIDKLFWPVEDIEQHGLQIISLK